MESSYLRYGQAASEYPISERTFRRLIASGALPAYKVAGIVVLARSDIETLIANGRKAAA